MNVQEHRVAVACKNSFYVSNDDGHNFTAAVFSGINGSSSISSVVGDGHHVFATFGTMHDDCDWNFIVVSDDDGHRLVASPRFGSWERAYGEMAMFNGALHRTLRREDQAGILCNLHLALSSRRQQLNRDSKRECDVNLD